MVSIASGVSDLKVTMASRRLRNSGLNTFSIAERPRVSVSWVRSRPRPMGATLISLEPAFDVMIRTT